MSDSPEYESFPFHRSFIIDDQTRSQIAISILLAILLPPYTFYVRHGFHSGKFWLCVFLTIICYFPGMIYSVYTIIADDIVIPNPEFIDRRIGRSHDASHSAVRADGSSNSTVV